MEMLILIVVLCALVFVYMKLCSKGFNINNKMMRIICKIGISKDSCLLVVNVMDKYYLCSSTLNQIQIIEELDNNKVLEYVSCKKEFLLKKE